MRVLVLFSFIWLTFSITQAHTKSKSVDLRLKPQTELSDKEVIQQKMTPPPAFQRKNALSVSGRCKDIHGGVHKPGDPGFNHCIQESERKKPYETERQHQTTLLGEPSMGPEKSFEIKLGAED